MPGARHLTVQWCFPLGLGWQERATSPCNGVVLLGPGCPGRATSSCNGVFRWVLDAIDWKTGARDLTVYVCFLLGPGCHGARNLIM